MEKMLKIGISSCLLGNQVRWNGRHKLDKYLANTIGRFIAYVPVCPEVEAGFNVPREPFRLVGQSDNPRLVTLKSQIDHTDCMHAWAQKRVKGLEKEDLWGFIFKSGSPSSGMRRVKVYNEKGTPHKTGVGMFARVFMKHFPLIPMEDDRRLHDPLIRENFILQIFTMKQWRDMVNQKPSMGKLVAFHTKNRLLIRSHSHKHHRLMNKLVTGGKSMPINELYCRYQEVLMAALRLKPTIRKNLKVLQHLMNTFKKKLSRDENQELLEIFNRYQNEHIPLIIPITLINHFIHKYDQPHLKGQTYLNSHPLELKLRNHC